MKSALLPEAAGKRNVLVDSNLLVLLIVGSVNPRRIAQFKRTSKYTAPDYFLLADVINEFAAIYTVAHVMSEVSNLADLDAKERQTAREILKQLIHHVTEPELRSSVASEHRFYPHLGLTDAAIASVAQEHDCLVLTDDLPLYLRLYASNVSAINYTYLRVRFGIV
ncbi:MAG TPA: PIN domain-containing protein [Bryobacteraceae bacterium]|jgi:rRNA-processing protein FCF1|nr:PIN domain-containing protein [Bryobacteraceae bacterium]